MSRNNKPKPSGAEKPASQQAIAEAAVRRVNNLFMRQPPAEFLKSGHHAVPKEELAKAEKVPVPDGRYRITGLDFIHEFKGGKWTGTERARPDTNPNGIVELP